MKFSTKEDLEVPIASVFDMLSDFDGFERLALQRGAEVTRVVEFPEPSAGMKWKVVAVVRGRQRVFDVTLSSYDGPNQMLFDIESPNFQGSFLAELVSLSPRRTRMRLELDLRPQTLSARLLMQSARLAKKTLNRRYKTRIAHFASDLEERHQRKLQMA